MLSADIFAHLGRIQADGGTIASLACWLTETKPKDRVMTKSALLFGAIGTLTETSDLQRRAFNLAFAQAGLDWYWDEVTYHGLLKKSGGKRRIADFAENMEAEVDVDALHASKIAHFAKIIDEQGLTPRAGVRNLIDRARERGIKVGFATSTSAEQRDAILTALAPHITSDDFDYLGHAGLVDAGKPAPDIYLDALSTLGVDAASCVAIEDTPDSAEAAIAAGVMTIGYVGEAAKGQPFPAGVRLVDTLSAALLPA